MKNVYVRVMSLVVMFVFISNILFAANVLSMGWEPWEPYQYKNSDGTITGLDVELVNAIVKNAGFDFKLKEVPWKRHLMLVKNGSLDLAAGASKTPEREEYAYFSDPYREEKMVLFVRKGEKVNIKSLKDIMNSNFKLGVVKEYYYGEEYAKLIKNPDFKKHLDEVISDEQNYKKLLAGRIDGFIADPFVTVFMLKQKKLLDKVEMLFTVNADNVYVMLSKKSCSPEVVKKFNESLKQLKKNGTYDKIMKKYLGASS